MSTKKLVSLLAVLTVFSACVTQKEVPLTPDDQTEQPETTIGGEQDEHGCIIPAGYSWCEAKQKCLRIWEESCSAEDNLRNYLRDNLSELSPEPEVLGGKFFVTKLTMENETSAIVEYEDGHNSFRARVLFTEENGQITVKKFTVLPAEEPAFGNDNMLAVDLKALFAEKYDKSEDQISITINKQDATHAVGTVRLAREDIEGGLFLAAQVDGEWKLLFDGNGAVPCQEIATYNFSQDMLVGICD